MLSRKKKNIVKLEARPEPPLPIPPPVSHKDRNKTLVKIVKSEHKFGIKSEIQQQPTTNAALTGLIPGLGKILTNGDGGEGSSRNVLTVEKQREIKRLLNCLSDWDNINDQNLIKLIMELKQNLETFDEKLNPIIQQVLSGHWHLRSAKVVTAMEQFLTEMLVVRAGFVGVALQALVSKFNPLSFNPSAKCSEIDEISLAEQKVFSVTHRNLQKLFHMFPMKRETGVKIMSSFYPFMGKEPHVHFCFVTNLLQSTEYMAEEKPNILHLIIHKLARIDVNIRREDLEYLDDYYQNSRSSVSIKTEDGGQEVFSMELDSSDSFTPNPLIQVVDVCLSLVMEHLSNELAGQDNDSLFRALCYAFETEIIPTFALNNVQFLFFYLISLNPSYASNFLDLLWEKATSVNTPAVIRIQVMAYMSGFLSRASFISITTVKRWLTRFADWANAYVVQKVSSCHWSSVNVDAHGPFYAVCQTIFYVFAFRNKELIGSRKCVAFTRTLYLGRLVTSDLNPLKACVKEVAESFVNAAHIHQISYCKTILERNQLATIPTCSRESTTQTNADLGASEQLESFFPFDPFVLPRSRVWIDPIYRLYEPYYEELKIEKGDSYSEADANEDSIDMELGASFTEKNSLNSSVDFFCNGISPYKFKSDIKGDPDGIEDFID